jgi:hypothetical protein
MLGPLSQEKADNRDGCRGGQGLFGSDVGGSAQMPIALSHRRPSRKRSGLATGLVYPRDRPRLEVVVEGVEP